MNIIDQYKFAMPFVAGLAVLLVGTLSTFGLAELVGLILSVVGFGIMIRGIQKQTDQSH